MIDWNFHNGIGLHKTYFLTSLVAVTLSVNSFFSVYMGSFCFIFVLSGNGNGTSAHWHWGILSSRCIWKHLEFRMPKIDQMYTFTTCRYGDFSISRFLATSPFTSHHHIQQMGMSTRWIAVFLLNLNAVFTYILFSLLFTVSIEPILLINLWPSNEIESIANLHRNETTQQQPQQQPYYTHI